jgi:hypothetical protein
MFTKLLARNECVSEPFANNGCFYGSTVLALSKYATILWTWHCSMYINALKRLMMVYNFRLRVVETCYTIHIPI